MSAQDAIRARREVDGKPVTTVTLLRGWLRRWPIFPPKDGNEDIAAYDLKFLCGVTTSSEGIHFKAAAGHKSWDFCGGTT